MAESQLPISFDGLGPIPSPKPSFAQGIGRDGSFAPIWTTEPKMPAQFRGAGSSAFTNPWDLIPTANHTSTVDYKVYPGAIGGKTPSNMFDTFNISATGTTYFWAACTMSDGIPTAVTIQTGSSPPTPQTIRASAPPASLNLVFNVVKDGKSYNILRSPTTLITSTIAYTTYSGTTNTPTNYYFYSWQ